VVRLGSPNTNPNPNLSLATLQAGLSVPLCDMGTLFVGFVLAHMTELYAA